MTDALDPFRDAREQHGAAMIELDGETITMLLRYRDVKRATHDWETFTSDAPFRVPIPAEFDVRAVRQLPIETDPPAHRDYRRIVRQPFGRRQAEEIRPGITRIADELLDEALASGTIECVRQFALPLQSRALALMLGRPREDAETWISWGIHVFHDPEGGHADELDAYLEAALDRAAADPGDDFFSLLVAGRFHDRRLTREEMLGFANLAFAGGRDTLINLVVNALFHLAEHPESLDLLRTDPALAASATEEFLRYYSPLTHIGRVATRESEVRGCPVSADSRISLAFASANRDSTVFERADECLLERSPNRHIAFGHGPHVCLGAPLTRAVSTVLLSRLAERVARLSVVDAVPRVKSFGSFERRVGFARLSLAFDAPGAPEGR